jgi:hypothetical protein
MSDATPPRRAEAVSRHGIAAPRGQDAAPGSRGGRFGRMFGFLAPADPGREAMDALFGLLQAASSSDDNEWIPAGYTYLGQFVDHDITFDPFSKLGHDNDPLALVNFRTPRLDLDSLYGSGPEDQPFLYDWDREPRGVKLLVGRNPPIEGAAPADEPACEDLPRNQQGRALIGDARNDENLIIAQLHLLFIRFHNKVVDGVCRRRSRPRDRREIFDEARRIVRWHYQWIVAHDFLTRLAGCDMACSVLVPGVGGGAPTVVRRFYDWRDEPVIPVEFSGAAYRCGHSMVRPQYRLTQRVTGGVNIMPAKGSHAPHLSGFRRLPASLELEWDRFFDTDPAVAPQPSLRIDERVTSALFALPPDGDALPYLNLQRGLALGLPAGGAVANAMGERPLSDHELGLDSKLITPAVRARLRHETPLWYYVLCEARWRGDGGLHLGPVGGRIVAEVIVGLLEGDSQSYLRQWPAWRPELPSRVRHDFTMPDLVRFATAVEDDPAHA